MITVFRLGQSAFRDHASRFSRKDFTRPQLLAVLALKEFEKATYRGTEALLSNSPELCDVVRLKRVPDHSTLCRAAKGLMNCADSHVVLHKAITLARSYRVAGSIDEIEHSVQIPQASAERVAE